MQAQKEFASILNFARNYQKENESWIIFTLSTKPDCVNILAKLATKSKLVEKGWVLKPSAEN